MLKNAPKFHEVAKRIVEITENCVLVAHNAQFDYRILKTEFKRLGYDFEKKASCMPFIMILCYLFYVLYK